MTDQAPLNPDALEAAAKELYDHFKNQAANDRDCWPEWEARDEVGHGVARDDAKAVVTAYLAVAQPVVRGYIIVDKKTNAIDWDGELHPSIESAIESMTGPHQSMCRTAEEEDDAANDGRTAWWRIYSIHTVTDRTAVDDV